MSSSKQPRLGLQTVLCPPVGIGTWQSNKGDAGQAVEWALEAGVRHIDTAFIYLNEPEIGEVLARWLKEGKIKRSELFVTTKLPMHAMHAEDVEKYMDWSLKNLQLDYVDLYLVHVPFGMKKNESGLLPEGIMERKVIFDKDTDLPSIWREMERMFRLGKARSIGVSNFSGKQVREIMSMAKIPIAVNQVECFLYFQQKKLREVCDEYGIRIMAYGPLGSPGREQTQGIAVPKPLEDPVVLSLAKNHGKTPAQILIRHLVQLNMIVIPKSIKKHRINENFDVLDFVLSDEDMTKLNGLDKGSAGRSFTFESMKGDVEITSLPNWPDQPEERY